MTDQRARITDYFSTSKNTGPDSLSQKRKLVARDLLADPGFSSDPSSPSSQYSSSSQFSDVSFAVSKRRRITAPKSRARLLVELATSPKKGDQATSCSSPLKSPRRPVLSSPVKTMISSLNLSKPPTSPVKSDSCAYYKYRNLVDSGLILPDKYRNLIETAIDVDNILVLILNRNEKPTFDRLKSGVERKSGRKFDQNKLAQIKSVNESSYILRYEKSMVSTKDLSSRLSLSLIVNPAKVVEGQLVQMKTLTSTDISRRKIELINILTGVVKSEHTKFLSSLDPPIILDDVNKVIKWHKNFDLNSLPDIEIKPYALPPPPVKANVGKLTAESFLKLTLKAPSSQASEDGVTQVSIPSSPSKSSQSSTITKGALKGLSTAFLDKIRAKEATKLALDMLRSPENEKKISMINSFPFYVRILLNYFTGEKKSVLSLELVVNKIIQSYPNYVSSLEVTEHLRYLSDLVPSWIRILEVRKGSFIKITDREKKIKDIEVILDRFKERLEQNILDHTSSQGV